MKIKLCVLIFTDFPSKCYDIKAGDKKTFIIEG